MAENNLEEKIEAGFRGVNTRLDTLDGRVNALDTSVNARLDTLDGRVGALDTGVAGLRTDVGDLTTHVYEVRDALLADNVKTRESTSIQIDALRGDMNVYADGVIAHTAKLENHETRIKKLETR